MVDDLVALLASDARGVPVVGMEQNVRLHAEAASTSPHFSCRHRGNGGR